MAPEICSACGLLFCKCGEIVPALRIQIASLQKIAESRNSEIASLQSALAAVTKALTSAKGRLNIFENDMTEINAALALAAPLLPPSPTPPTKGGDNG